MYKNAVALRKNRTVWMGLYSHKVKAEAKVKEIKEQAKKVKEYTTNIKENVYFRSCFRAVWMGP